MKITTMLAMLALGVSALAVNAQNAAGPPPADQRPSGQTGPAGGPGGLELNGQRPPPSPLLRALDVNHDGVIDANEIANASAALLTLDKNGDGKLTPEELRPQRPARADISAGGAANLPARQAGPAGSPGGLGLDGQRPPPSRLMMALDANHDGVIDANEIANASAALLTLDKNGDGKLTPDELRPPRRSGAARGPAGPGRNGSPPDALLRALDKDGNGVIDESEIADAPASLLTLDKNGDGKLTQDELRPLGPAKGDGPDVPDVQGLPPSRLMMALDTNHDGVIDANEIANAPAALKMLDQNGDGELSQDELRPARPLKDGGPPPAAQ